MPPLQQPSHSATAEDDASLSPADEAVLTRIYAAADALVREAQHVLDPMRSRGLKTLRSIDQTGSFMLYEHVTPLSGSTDNSDSDGSDSDEGELSVDEDVQLQTRAPPPRRKYAAPVRITGATSLRKATLDEFIGAFGHGSEGCGKQSLSPGPARTRTLCTVHESADTWVGMQWLVLPPRGLAARRREFVAAECQKKFRLPDGRAGWVQCLHSVDAVHPPAARGDWVRGSVQQTGVVVVESHTSKRSLHVVATAELNLRGGASAAVQRSVSTQRVESVLAGLAATIEQSRVELLSFAETLRFEQKKIERRDSECCVCARQLSHCGGLVTLTRHACRMCAGSVCKDCSRVWTLERQRSTTPVGGGRVATPTRVCRLCYGYPVVQPSRPPQDGRGTHDRSEQRKPQGNCRTRVGLRPSPCGASRPGTAVMRPSQLEFRLSTDHPAARTRTAARIQNAFSSSMRTIRFDLRRSAADGKART